MVLDARLSSASGPRFLVQASEKKAGEASGPARMQAVSNIVRNG